MVSSLLLMIRADASGTGMMKVKIGLGYDKYGCISHVPEMLFG